MNRNTMSFDSNPVNIDMSRSTFNRDSSLKTSFNVGDVVPFYIDEILPGDTLRVNTNKVVRLQTPITPFMDYLYLDTYYFFVPNRILWDHWKELHGENNDSAWTQEIEYEVPQITTEDDGWEIGTIADYFGIPTGVGGLSVNALPFRAYSLIINDWFRDQNLQQPVYIPRDDSNVIYSNGDDYVTDLHKGGKPFVASKLRDYFTSCLPAPQKGPDVTLDFAGGSTQVYGNGKALNLTNGTVDGGLFNSNKQYRYTAIGDGFFDAVLDGVDTRTNTLNMEGPLGLPSKGTNSNALVDLPGGSFSINTLRTAFQIQKLYEKDARGGTRYIEIIKAHFGVTSPDSRMQRPEYLGGNRVPLNVNQVVQTSQTDNTPMGDTSAYSLTYDSNSDFTKSFTEHGFVIGLMVARYDHSYQQGLDRFWSRKSRFDYYFPVFANLGEQAVLNKEIFAQGTSDDEEVFGYQEAWADYRYKPSRVTGEMRSQAPLSLDIWHLGDHYDSLPSLSDEFIREDKGVVDRVLAVTSDISNQLFADFYIQNRTTRAMPLRSIPGLIDHH